MIDYRTILALLAKLIEALADFYREHPSRGVSLVRMADEMLVEVHRLECCGPE